MMTLAMVTGGDSPSFFIGRIYVHDRKFIPGIKSLPGQTYFLPFDWDEEKKALVINNSFAYHGWIPSAIRDAATISLDILYECSSDSSGIQLVMPNSEGRVDARMYSTLVRDIPLVWNEQEESFTIISEDENDAIQELTQ